MVRSDPPPGVIEILSCSNPELRAFFGGPPPHFLICHFDEFGLILEVGWLLYESSCQDEKKLVIESSFLL
jgi:hypothetical protein